MKTNISEWPPYSPSDAARREGSIAAARLMANGAMTAPKGGGVDQIECSIVSGQEEQEQLARKVEELATLNPNTKMWKHSCRTEAVMTREADCILLIGNYRAGDSPLDAGCGLCSGAEGCKYVYQKKNSKYGQIDRSGERSEDTGRMVDGPLCSFWAGDLGYAVGSALAMAKRLLVDSRPMFSIGVAGRMLGYCPESAIVIGLPVATLAKNPFVDVFPDYPFLTQDKAISQLRKNHVIARQIVWYSYRNWYPKKEAQED